MDYLKRFGKQWCQAVGSGDGILMEKFVANHHRYLELVKSNIYFHCCLANYCLIVISQLEHGPPEQSEMNDVQNGVLKNRLLRIFILFLFFV